MKVSNLPSRRKSKLSISTRDDENHLLVEKNSKSNSASDFGAPSSKTLKSNYVTSTSTSTSTSSQLSPSPTQTQTPTSSLIDDWKNISLILIICTLLLILQAHVFQNAAIKTTGFWTPYNKVNNHPSWCPHATCTNTPRCKPCQRRFLIIVATGRSGSTTLMNLLDLLPSVRMAGENKGQLLNDFTSYRNLRDSIELQLSATEEVEGAWKHFPIPAQSLSCPIQGVYEAINPPPELSVNYRGTYDDSETILGFKTVRLHEALMAENRVELNDYGLWDEFFTDNFPCARFVFNIRGDIEKQVQSWLLAFGTKLDGDMIRKYNMKLSQLAAVLGPDRARVIDMSEWSKKDGSGLVVLNDLIEWLGYRNCKFTSLIHSNKDGYGKDTTKLSLGKHCHLHQE